MLVIKNSKDYIIYFFFRHSVDKDCRYWHFMPTERHQELVEKYKEIIGEKEPDTGMMNQIKDVKFELERILGFRSWPKFA